MRRQLSVVPIFIAAICFIAPARAGEDAIRLKPGKGIEAVEQNCAACHSLDYIEMNSPFLDAKGWQAEVTKMVRAFMAPISAPDQQKIVEYLAANYANP
jgi:sulfite dehydrogenase (cytochrome) subunit B